MAFIQLKTYAKTLKTKTNVQVILPTPLASETMFGETRFRYYDKSRLCPVLYLLHGTFGDEGDWTRFSMIETYAQAYNVAIVMPQAANSCYRDMPRGGPQYYTYITQELPEMIRWMFPVSDRREDTFIAGLSMGGSGAFKIGMSKPAQYGYVASLSGGFSELTEKIKNDSGSAWALAFKPDEKLNGTIDDPFWLASKLIENKVDYPKFYMCCGTEDFLYPANCQFRDHLDKIGLRYDYHEQHGVHDWIFWNDEIQRVFEWLPIEKRYSGSQM